MQKHTRTQTRTHTHRDSDEYSIVAFSKNAKIITNIIEGSLISTEALFSLRALFGAKRIHSYTRIASLIRTWLSDLYITRSRHFWRGNLWVQLHPKMKTFLLMPRRASNLRRTTFWGVNID